MSPERTRELRAAAIRAARVLRDVAESLERAVLEAEATAPASPRGTAAHQLADELAALERRRIVDALVRCGGNQTRAAAWVGMPRRTFVKRLATYGIRARDTPR